VLGADDLLTLGPDRCGRGEAQRSLLTGHHPHAQGLGDVPRGLPGGDTLGQPVVVVGEAGTDVTLERAQHAAQVCAMRALVLIAQAEGSLDAVQQVLSVRVYTRSAPGFTQQSEVANAASDLLVRVLGPAGTHTRTSVGVAQLPKGAVVELDMAVAVA